MPLRAHGALDKRRASLAKSYLGLNSAICIARSTETSQLHLPPGNGAELFIQLPLAYARHLPFITGSLPER